MVVLALLATSCDDEPTDPAARLAGAADATAAGSFRWVLTLDADPAALRSLGDAGQATAALESFEIKGVRNGEGSSITVSLVGFEAFELRRVDDEHLYVRVAVPELAALSGTEVEPRAVVARLQRQGLRPPVVAAVAAALDGRWFGVEGAIDAEQLRRAAGGPAGSAGDGGASARAALGGDIVGFIDRFVAVSAPTADGNEQVYEVELHARQLIAAVLALDPRQGAGDAELSQVPRELPATIRTGEGVLRGVGVDVAEVARRLGRPVEGSIRVALVIEDHGDAPAVTGPEDATTVTSDQLLEAVRTVAEAADRAEAGGSGRTDGASPGR